GFTAGDQVGSVMALTNGNYVILSPYWDNGALADAGTVTFGNGTTGLTGVITAGNSAVGLAANTGLYDVIVDPVNGTFLPTFVHEGSGTIGVGSQAPGFAARLDALAAPPALAEDAGPQTVTLTGIGGGTDGAITVTATSDNPALIPDPT